MENCGTNATSVKGHSGPGAFSLVTRRQGTDEMVSAPEKIFGPEFGGPKVLRYVNYVGNV